MTTPNNTVAGLRDLIGQLVSMAAITDEHTARSIAERIEAALASPAPSAGVGVEEALRLMVGAATPVSTDIDPRGHTWSEAYLDQALPAARAALYYQPEK